MDVPASIRSLVLEPDAAPAHRRAPVLQRELLLQAALCGDHREWECLQEMCVDRRVAEELRAALLESPTVSCATAQAWLHVLEELHPGMAYL